jgi:hypothetical protein
MAVVEDSGFESATEGRREPRAVNSCWLAVS